MTYTYTDLERWISEWEGPALEFKQSVQNKSGETLSAFANTYGGILVFGVDESKNKAPLGLSNPDEESKRLRQVLDQCRPNPKPEQHFIRHESKTFIVLKVEQFPQSQNPCFFGKRCFIRQGTTNLELAGEDLIDFLRKRTLLNYEESRTSATLKDLEIDKIHKLLKARGSQIDGLGDDNLKRILVGLRVASQNGEFYLKNAALLFFAKEPKTQGMGLDVRVVKYSGAEPELSAVKLDKRLTDTIPELILHSFELVSENIGKTYSLDGPERKTVLDYPTQALREAITNAIGHRDYYDPKGILIEIFDDRLRITNPGGLLAGQTIENFDRTPQHRNPICYLLLDDLGLGEGLGQGIRKIRTQFRERGLPDPEFFQLGNMFQIVLHNSSSKRPRKQADFENQRQRAILVYLGKNSSLNAAEYAKIAGVTKPTILNDLNELIKQGKVRRVGQFRGAYYELVPAPHK